MAIAGPLAMLAAAPARANPDWPDRPITMMHGFPPGGPTDLVARIVADGLTRRLGQRIVIESKPGASGTTAAALVARAAPDGYTLFAIPSGHAFAAATYKTLPYRTIDDFSMISMFTEYPYLLATYADHSMRTVADLIALARTRSTPLLYGTPGNGSGPHLAVELLAKEAQVHLQHVPYRGSAPAALDLVGARSRRQAPRLHDGPGGGAHRIRQGRQAARARGHRRAALFRASRRPDHRRGRCCRLRGDGLAGFARARGSCPGDRRSLERGGRRHSQGADGGGAPARARQRSAAHDPRRIPRAHRRRRRQVDGGRGRQQFRTYLTRRKSCTECRFGIRRLLSSPRKRGSILQSRWLWVPACAGTTAASAIAGIFWRPLATPRNRP